MSPSLFLVTVIATLVAAAVVLLFAATALGGWVHHS